MVEGIDSKGVKMKEFSFLIYKTEQEDVSINALIKDETIWLTQKAMAEIVWGSDINN